MSWIKGALAVGIIIVGIFVYGVFKIAVVDYVICQKVYPETRSFSPQLARTVCQWSEGAWP